MDPVASVWIDVITRVGFPVAVAWWVLTRLDRDVRELRDQVRDLAELLRRHVIVVGPETDATTVPSVTDTKARRAH